MRPFLSLLSLFAFSIALLTFASAPPAAAGGVKRGLAACPHGFSCVPAGHVRRNQIGNPDGRAYLTTDPNYLAFPQPRAHGVRRRAAKRHRVARRYKVRRGGAYIHTRRYGRVSLHGRTKFCSDHVEWHGRHGVRDCVWVLNSLLDRRGHRLERRGYKRH